MVNPYNILSDFFDLEQYIEFRLLQKDTGILVAGDTAARFFDRSVPSSNSLTLYVQTCWAEELFQWLEDIGCIREALESRGGFPIRRRHLTLAGNIMKTIFTSDIDGIDHIHPTAFRNTTNDTWVFVVMGGNRPLQSLLLLEPSTLW